MSSSYFIGEAFDVTGCTSCLGSEHMSARRDVIEGDVIEGDVYLPLSWLQILQSLLSGSLQP